MLNINRIASDINFKSLTKIDVSNILKLPYTTAINRMKHGNWTPDEVEILADYFGRTIAYYFDKEEKQQKILVGEEILNVANEPCNKCEVLQAKLDGANALVESQKQTIAALQGEHKKETPDASIAQAV